MPSRQARRDLSGHFRSDARCRDQQDPAGSGLQNDIPNRHSPITIVAAISSNFDDALYPTEVLVAQAEGGLSVDSVVLLNQIRSIDRRRLTKRLGAVRPTTMEKVERAMQISLGLLKV